MNYKRIVVTAYGGPETMQVVEDVLDDPGKGEARIKILATQVCAPDIATRYGQSPFVPKPPFTPGYAFIGEVEKTGPDTGNVKVGDRVAALTAYGSYAEYICWEANRLIPVPENVDPVQGVTLILNYIVAYHVMQRWARVKAGETVLIIGASGGIGTALLQLGKLAELKMYGLASASKHRVLKRYGAVAIDYRSQDFVEFIREAEPEGLKAVFNGMAGSYFRRSFSLLGPGGRLIGYGNPMGYAGMFKVLGLTSLFNLLPNRRAAKYYSTGISHLKWNLFLEDWAALFKMLESGQIEPIIAARFPILEAAKANELLESGAVIGNVVLLAPEFL